MYSFNKNYLGNGWGFYIDLENLNPLIIFPNLEYLDLYGINIISLKSLKPIKKLKSISVHDCKISNEEKEKFILEHPKCSWEEPF